MNKLTSLKPILSEKAFQLSKQNVYMFDVSNGMSKLEVVTNVKSQFGVEVSNVRCANLSGKKRKIWQKRSGWRTTQKADKRRAYVTLAQGNRLPFFEEENKDKKQPKSAAKKVKKPAKAEAGAK